VLAAHLLAGSGLAPVQREGCTSLLQVAVLVVGHLGGRLQVAGNIKSRLEREHSMAFRTREGKVSTHICHD
jgi:hypothetical protein